MAQRVWARKEDVMGLRYRANIDITVNGRKFSAGEEIGESISPGDLKFLLREKYIEEVPAGAGGGEEAGKVAESGTKNPEAAKPERANAKPASSKPPAGKRKGDALGQAAEDGRNPRE